jgi:hypothetical protein
VIRRASAAVTLLLFLAAGCGNSGTPVDNPSSPLGAGGDSVKECVPDRSGTTMTNGWTGLDNGSKGTVVIEQVSFYGDHHLRFVQAVVVPIRFDAVGMAEGWPPPRSSITQPGVQWNKRVAAIGARMPPSPYPGNRNLVIAMRPTAHKGIAAGVQVRYRENGQQYELRTHTEFVVIVAKSAIGRC